jgi:uncharacterized membrane protein
LPRSPEAFRSGNLLELGSRLFDGLVILDERRLVTQSDGTVSKTDVFGVLFRHAAEIWEHDHGGITMTHLDMTVGSDVTQALPVVRKIGMMDLKDALAKGIEDFRAIPTHVIFLSIIYPVGALLVAQLTLKDLFHLFFPLAAGFALIGPFAALGLYELSRRRELGLDLSWTHVFGVRHSRSLGGIFTLGALLVAIFLLWVVVAQAIYVATFGKAPPVSIPNFLRQVFTTPQGWTLIVVGNGVGFLFAVVVLMISVVSFPLLLDRNVGAGVAILTSVRVVLRNPVTMAVWGLIIAGLLLIGSLPLFVGLAVVMPILGHSSWHLYRKVVESDPNAQKEEPIAPKPRRRRYAAQFPASLFAGEDQR